MRVRGLLLNLLALCALVELASCSCSGKKKNVGEQEQEPVHVPVYKWGICIDDYNVTDSIIGKKETLSKILLPFGVSNLQLINMEKCAKKVYKLSDLQAGKSYHVLTRTDSTARTDYFIYDINAVEYVVYCFGDSMYVKRDAYATDTVRKFVSGPIEGSLWNGMISAGASDNIAAQIPDIYAWTIDFFGIQPQDSFAVCYEEVYKREDTSLVSTGRLLAANIIHGKEDHYAIRYNYRGGKLEYYDLEGGGMRQQFLKAPLQYTRISSKFSNARKHPVLKIVRPHHGVDYAAPSGTPVHSIGDGKIIKMGWDTKGGGNYIRVRHNSTYETVYMHLKGFAKGMAVGKQVKQGQTIGYVGQTGTATGPHLDFRVFKNGTAIDPLKMERTKSDPIAPADLPAYKTYIEQFRADFNF
ncbi:MAG: peptidoglycan DD-metalloendopeptidase family protein [Bacteroidaceae bacterium]|nr:peptidoglycan DD-metalloendopeptidase family protein [Bacteroidaceae bacterium]